MRLFKSVRLRNSVKNFVRQSSVRMSLSQSLSVTPSTYECGICFWLYRSLILFTLLILISVQKDIHARFSFLSFTTLIGNSRGNIVNGSMILRRGLWNIVICFLTLSLKIFLARFSANVSLNNSDEYFSLFRMFWKIWSKYGILSGS